MKTRKHVFHFLPLASRAEECCRGHRPYSRQVTEQLPLLGSLHSHQLVYPKQVSRSELRKSLIFFWKFILMFIVFVYGGPPLVSSFYVRLTITSWCVPGESKT